MRFCKATIDCDPKCRPRNLDRKLLVTPDLPDGGVGDRSDIEPEGEAEGQREGFGL